MPTFEITAPDGKVYDITGETQEGALAALKKHLGDDGQEQPAPNANNNNTGINSPTGGFKEAFLQGVDAPLDAMGTTARVLGAEKTGEFLTNLTDAPEGYESASAKFIEGDEDGSYAYRYLPKAAVEQGAQFAGQQLARVGGAAVGSMFSPAGSVIGGISAPVIVSAVQHLGGIAEERARNQGREKPNKDDFLYASTTTAGIALLDSLGLGSGKVFATALKEFGTESLQSVVEQTGTSVNTEAGLNIDPRQAVGEGIIGGASAGGVNTAISTVSKTGEVVFKPRQELDPEVDQAAGDVARMLNEIASDEGLNLKNIDPTSKKGANTALDTARSKNTTDINTAAEILRKEVLKGADTFTRQRFNQAIKNANTKVGTVVSNEDIKFIKDTVGKTLEGQQLVQSLYKSNVVTELYAAGLKGGFSKFTDNFNPIPQIGKSYDPARSIGTMLNLGAIAGTGGSSLLTQVPLVAGGRAIDAVTGRRSKVNRFVKKNRKSTGMSSPVGVAVEGRTKRLKNAQKSANNAKIAAAKAERAKDQAAQNVVKYNEGYAPNYGDPRLNQKADPRGTVHNALAQKASLKGMSIKEIDTEIQRIIDERLADKRTSKEEKKSLRTYANFNSLGAMPKGDQTLSLAIAAIRERFNFPNIDPAAPTSPVAPTPPAPPQRSPEVQQGIDDNRKFVQNLKNKLASDLTVSDGDRAVLNDSLDEYGLSLGSNPEQASLEITFRARKALDNRQLVEKYLMPYHQRVLQQQAEIKVKGKKNAPTKTTATPQETPQPSGQGTASGQTAVQGTGEAKPTQLASSGLLATTTQETPKVKKVTVKAVKDIIPDAEAIIQIGKKGTKYENGIQDVDTALEVANLLGITAKMLNSDTDLQKLTGTDEGTAALHSWSPEMEGFGSSVFAIKPSGTIFGKKVTKINSLMTLLHEMGHSLTQGNMDGKGEFGLGTVKNPFSGQENLVGGNSYNKSVMKPILEGKGKDHPAIKEILAFQEAGKAFTQKDPDSKVEARDIRKMLMHIKISNNPDTVKSLKKKLKRTRAYTTLTAELSVDPMWVYLMNPKLAKELMPINTKLIKKEFDKANNGKIKFYGHPLATILAIVTAMVAMNSGEDEEPNEGILSPQDGILSA
jgi:hypothetical protein